MSNRMPPKQSIYQTEGRSFGTMSNRRPSKLNDDLLNRSITFGTMSNRRPSKPRSLKILTLLIPQIAVVSHKLPTMVRPYCVALLS